MQGEEGSRQAPLFKTELIRPHGPWHGLDNLELSTLEYIDWFNHRRLHSQIGMIPPAEAETACYARTRSTDTVDIT